MSGPCSTWPIAPSWWGPSSSRGPRFAPTARSAGRGRRAVATRRPLVATPGRLDAVLAELARVPRADVQRAIASGRVTVDGQVRSKSFRLSGGERIDADMEDRDELEGE